MNVLCSLINHDLIIKETFLLFFQSFQFYEVIKNQLALIFILSWEFTMLRFRRNS